MHSAKFRQLITLIVTSIVGFVALYWLLPGIFTDSMQNLEKTQELMARGGKEKSLLELGIESMKAGNAEAGWKYLTTAIEQDPNNPDLYVERAHADVMLGNRGQRELDIEQALSLNPDHVGALLWKASSLCLNSEIEDAECFTSVEHILKLAPTNYEAFFIRAGRYRDIEETDKALTDFTSAIENMPREADSLTAFNIYANRARIYFDRNMLKEAIADFNSAIDVQPDTGPYMLYGYHGAFTRRLSIIDPESESYEPLERLIARLKH